MDERVRRTLETYEDNADRYATTTADRSAVRETRDRFLDALPCRRGKDDGERRAGVTDRPRILDVGCGAGWDSRAFADAGCDVVSLDLADALVRETRSRVPSATALRADMRALPVATDSVDGLWACASLLHVPRSDVQATLTEFERALVPGGVALVTLKRTGGEAGTEGRFGGDRHFERYERAEVAARFDEAGFEAVDVETVPNWIAVTARTQ